MTDRYRRCRQLSQRVIIAGFEGKTLPLDLVAALREGGLGGIILFRRNIDSAPEVAALIEEIRETAPPGRPPLVGVDQEGGRVVRLKEPLTVLPPARRFGELDDPELTRQAGELVGMELGALGFTMDFAPVLDVDTRPDSPVIGDRAFGPDPMVVERHALAFAAGLCSGGVSPCAKHFPGHGDAALDSHLALPRVDRDADDLRSREMVPFAAWAHRHMGPVMTAHVVYPALDPENPATLSPAIIGGELRQRLGFQGAVLSDDLEMGALQAFGGPGPAAVRALGAGVDGLLVCRRLDQRERVTEALTREAVDNPSFEANLEAAAGRLASMAVPEKREPLSWIGSPAHRALQERITRRLTTDTE
jgi:beta-N-acetylhexosaminidase